MASTASMASMLSQENPLFFCLRLCLLSWQTGYLNKVSPFSFLCLLDLFAFLTGKQLRSSLPLGLLESYTSKGPRGALLREQMRAQEVYRTWALAFEVTFSCGLILQTSILLLREEIWGQTPYILNHLPEESQITKQLSCPKGPQVGMGVRDVGESQGGRRGEGKRILELQPGRRACELLIP